MNQDRDTLKQTYDRMSTDALLDLHAAGTLTDDAYDVLESVLQSRAIPIPNRPAGPELTVEKASPVKRHCIKWAVYFSIIGIVIPIVCFIFDFEPTVLMRLCELCWPSSFILMVMGTRFELPIVVLSIAFNAIIWAGTGWLIGYATSGNTKT